MIKVTITAPDDVLDIKGFIKDSVQAVNDTVDDTLKDFNVSKKDFSDEHQFEFKVQKATGVVSGKIAGWVETDDENYVRLNEGFVIKAVSGKRMAFRTGYVAKTARGVIPSRPGGAFGPKIVRVSRKGPTTVPGRQFDLVIRNANITNFYKRVLGGK